MPDSHNPDRREINIEPDAQILHVLTYLEMRPIDSLCELIDNSIDSLKDESGSIIVIELPTKREIEEGAARVRVRDNGPGMSLQQLESALKAGYSSKPKHGTLGLFGVGFNIATGKLGRKTRLITARAEDNYAIETLVDLVSLKRSGSFKLTATMIPKPQALQHGTIVEVSDPWGEGNQNVGFMMKLVSIGRPKTLSMLGRIYATILRRKKLRVLLGEDTLEPYYHCVWGDTRYVEHAKHGKIPAVYRFDNKVIRAFRACATCGSTMPEKETKCIDPSCGSSSAITREERLSGWVGIQRYLDSNHYGIDLIRNGRLIRILETEAFFKFTDPDTGDTIVDYPIDDRQGRIVGEVHLNHVPVDPAKQNFERSSPEWRRAIEYLRGNSSLQPSQTGADKNESPIFKLYQGYRKVRVPGRRSMTMGKWLPGSTEPTQLSKSEVEKLKEAFDRREPGYFEDTEWWKLVEQAENKPVPGLRKCPSCHLESPEGLDECPHCSHIFEGKHCIVNDCGKEISRNSVTCPFCGGNQIPDVREPWKCAVCGGVNSSDLTSCSVCSSPLGALNPVSKEGLKGVSYKAESLSLNALVITLASGSQSNPVDVVTYLTEGKIFTFRSDGSKVRLPSVRFADSGIEIYIDPSHPLFEQVGVSLENQVASETAAYIFDYHKSVVAKAPIEHSLTKLTYDILMKYWPEKFSASAVDAELESLFLSIQLKLADAVYKESSDVYANLSQEEKQALASEIIRKGRDLSELAELKGNGQFVHFLRPRGLLEVFRLNPNLFFDGQVWSITYRHIPIGPTEGGDALRTQIKTEYGSLLEIAALYAEKGTGDQREAAIAKAALKLLSNRLAD